MITIREEESGESLEIRIVIQRAFGQDEEADIVDKLRAACTDSISLVSLSGDRIVGQILFTPVTIQAKERIIVGMGLGPIAVLPEFQRQGIGSRLIRTALDLIERANYPFVIVLGHPTYYPRFGFVPAFRHGIKSEYENAPDEPS